MILLDTHIWLRWLNVSSDALSDKIIRLIETSETVSISAISIWEALLLKQSNRITIDMNEDEWLKQAIDKANIAVIPINSAIARTSTNLPYHHKDPADRFIIAKAITHQCPLISFDEKFKTYNELSELLIND